MSDSALSVRYRKFRNQARSDIADHRYQTKCPPMIPVGTRNVSHDNSCQLKVCSKDCYKCKRSNTTPDDHQESCKFSWNEKKVFVITNTISKDAAAIFTIERTSKISCNNYCPEDVANSYSILKGCRLNDCKQKGCCNNSCYQKDHATTLVAWKDVLTFLQP